MLKLYATLYLKGQLAAAMMLWPGATENHCKAVNTQYAMTLAISRAVVSGELKLTDVRLECEWHTTNPMLKERRYEPPRP